MSPLVANFLFEAANLLLLAAVLGWVLFAPVRRALDTERERHATERLEAERLRAEAEALSLETRGARQTAERELEQRRRETLAAAEARAVQLLEEARRAVQAERRRLEAELEAARNAESNALAGAVGRIAAESVRRLLEAVDGPALDTALIRAACAELGDLPPAARTSVLVESARPLAPHARELLAGVLADGFSQRVVAELGAGVRVTTPAGQIDATAAAFARRAARVLGSAARQPAADREAGRA